MDPIVKLEPPPHIKWRNMKRWVAVNSKPKKIPKPPKIKRGPKFSNPARLDIISKPIPSNKYIKPSKDPTSWVYKMKHLVSERAKNYVATQRITELATPTHVYKRPDEKKIPASAFTYEPSARILEISKPVKPRKKWRYRRPRLVKKRALKYKASKRIIDMSKPMIKSMPEKQYVFTVNPIALAYKASKRVRIMARPRKQYTQKDLETREERRLRRKQRYDKRRQDKTNKRDEKKKKSNRSSDDD